MPSAQTQHQVQRRFLLNVVIAQRATILKLFARKDEALLIGRDSFLVLNLGLDIINRIRRLNIQGDGLSGERLDKSLP